MTLDSYNVRFIRIFAEDPWRGGANNNGVAENVDFRAFGRYVFGTLGNEANIVT